MALKGGKQGTRRARSPEAPGAAGPGFAQTASWRANYEASLGGVLASCRRRGGGISTVLKTLGMGKVPEPSQHVNVGKGYSEGGTAVGRRPAPRTVGVSLLGACSSKGCPTKSVENEDRYVHGKISLQVATSLGPGGLAGEEEEFGGALKKRGAATTSVPCWAFATFDGHAGPACANFLKENFMEHLRAAAAAKGSVVADKNPVASTPGAGHSADGNADSAAGGSPLGARPGDGKDGESPQRKKPAMEVVLARLLTDTLASLTRTFERAALSSGEISGACVIAGLYCEGALVLANIGDCQAVYHGQVKSAPGSPVTAQTTIHDASNPGEVNRFLTAGGFISPTGRFQGILEPSRTVGDVDVKADAPKGCIASYPELFKVDIASEVFRGEENSFAPPFLVLATDGIWDETCATTVVDEVKDGIAKIQAHKRRFAIREGHRRDSSFGSTTFTDGESDSEEDETEFCGSGEWAEQGMDLAERVVSLARGRYDDATALVVVFE